MSSEGILIRALINLLNQYFSFLQVFLQQLLLLRRLSRCLLVTWSRVCVFVCVCGLCCTVSSRHLTHYPERIWQVTWILMVQQHYPWELLKEFLDYLPKQLLPNSFPFTSRGGVEQHANVPIVWFVFPTSVPHSATQISHLICIRTKGNGEVPAGTYLMGDTSCSPRFPAVVRPCYLHPALPPRILTARLPEKEIRIIQMSI